VNVSALIAGLGLTGFALGFALKDAVSNLLAGLLILIYKPFRMGDHISVTGLEGEVVNIDLRYTTLQAGQKTFLIPNSNLFTNPIILVRDAGSPPSTT
jgi:small conductance mechanosensitive channel